MNVDIIAVDKLREGYVREGCALYRKRLSRYVSINVIETKPSPGDLAAESRALLDRVSDGAAVWALDRAGAALDSPALAAKLAAIERSGMRRLCLLIGGAEGLHASALERANFVWSLSPLTFLHEMARLILLEQLYRAFKINRGEPYHR